MKTKIVVALIGVLLAVGAVGAATVWAQGTHVLGVAQGVAGDSAAQLQQADNACQAYEQALAHQLGIELSKLQQAQKDAEKSLVDQALKDGKLTQAQADAAKKKIDSATFQHCPRFDRIEDKRDGAKGAVLTTGLDAAAHALGMTTDQLKAALKSGQSIEDIAKSKNVDLNTLKQSIVSAEKAKIDQAVKDGKLTQTQADRMKSAIDQHADQLLNVFKHHAPQGQPKQKTK